MSGSGDCVETGTSSVLDCCVCFLTSKIKLEYLKCHILRKTFYENPQHINFLTFLFNFLFILFWNTLHNCLVLISCLSFVLPPSSWPLLWTLGRHRSTSFAAASSLLTREDETLLCTGSGMCIIMSLSNRKWVTVLFKKTKKTRAKWTNSGHQEELLKINLSVHFPNRMTVPSFILNRTVCARLLLLRRKSNRSQRRTDDNLSE